MLYKTALFVALLCLFLITSCENLNTTFHPDTLTAANGWFVAESSVRYDSLLDAVIAANDESITGIPDALFVARVEANFASLQTAEPCETDDTYFFTKGMPIAFRPGPDHCDESYDFDTENIFEGNRGWALTETYLIVDMEGESYLYELVRFSPTIMVLRASDMFSVDVLDQCVKAPVSVELVLCTR